MTDLMSLTFIDLIHKVIIELFFLNWRVTQDRIIWI